MGWNIGKETLGGSQELEVERKLNSKFPQCHLVLVSMKSGRSKEPSPGNVSTSSSATLFNTPSMKRKLHDSRDEIKRKTRPKHSPNASYVAPKGIIPMNERKALKFYEVEDDSDQKPIMLVESFTVFDPKHENEMVNLDLLEVSDGLNRHFQCSGHVIPDYEDVEDEDEEDGIEPVWVDFSAIYSFWYEWEERDFFNLNRLVWIETAFAWYILTAPSEQYIDIYGQFLTPRYITRRIIDAALGNPLLRYSQFVDDFVKEVGPLGHPFTKNDLQLSKPHLRHALKALSFQHLKDVPLIKKLLPAKSEEDSDDDSDHEEEEMEPSQRPKMKRPPRRPRGNLDLRVLANPNRTCVTHLIHTLAAPFFHESPLVVGPKPSEQERRTQELEKKRKVVCRRKHLRQVLDVARRISEDSSRKIRLEDVDYQPGDVVIVPIGDDNTKDKKRHSSVRLPLDSEVPDDGCIGDYFWFAKIMYLDEKEAHVQWFNHGSQIGIPEELSHDQELFLQELCGYLPLDIIVAKVNVLDSPTEVQRAQLPADHFFCRSVYNPGTPSFSDLNTTLMELAKSLPAPECVVCLSNQSREQQELAQPLYETVDGKQSLMGISIGGTSYHVNDFLLYQGSADRAKGSPQDIGQLVSVNLKRKNYLLTVRKVGRINTVKFLPDDYFRDEAYIQRHLYLTNEKAVVESEALIRMVHVIPRPKDKDILEAWIGRSPYHFYLKHCFPELHVDENVWKSRTSMLCKKLDICTSCHQAEETRAEEMAEYLKYCQRNPLIAIDLFGGCGAFGHGLTLGSQHIKVKYTVEISPSAAETYRKNSPDTIVINQCVNKYLKYAFESYLDDAERPVDLLDNSKFIPEPPQRGEIDVVLAGFPCQGFSGLNMFKRSNDPRNNLILSTLSEIDRLRPKYVFLENVPGFLTYRLNSVQTDAQRMEDGIEQGGLKLLHRALLEMRYQTVFGKLDAVHYGAPQSRVRFFLIAAKHGLPLPSLPQPTHAFPIVTSFDIKLCDDTKAIPIASPSCTAAHKFVSIKDAIWDLCLWDYGHPDPSRLDDEKRANLRQRKKDGIPAIPCEDNKPGWGWALAHGYSNANPVTRFQSDCRPPEMEVELQHFTRQLPLKVVQCIHHIPLLKEADWRSIPMEQGRFLLTNVMSAMARRGNRPGAYGRLDEDGTFNTIVCNVHPTAKQAKVLHPKCHRMLTVRELARAQGFPDWFEFVALDNNVLTMVRNAVSLFPSFSAFVDYLVFSTSRSETLSHGQSRKRWDDHCKRLSSRSGNRGNRW
ncbi:hypothetical protein D9758_009647 [Tetrapyrgos nigripes]|uniref:DNA (cytosine-5-)-methyltransferase n=1 Tax=Tetrapyrgos nigripes TaxID=182062 RepID=A0A8H5CQF7_9AGAR|nr:hypothetical protein D9758_009647 [Tetrapyrgos nigripes]